MVEDSILYRDTIRDLLDQSGRLRCGRTFADAETALGGAMQMDGKAIWNFAGQVATSRHLPCQRATGTGLQRPLATPATVAGSAPCGALAYRLRGKPQRRQA